MTSLAPDAPRIQRRESSPRPRSSSRRRPRLLRASATEPSITTSSASKGVLTGPQSNRKATDLLSRVAVSNSAAAAEALLRSSTASSRSFEAETASMDGTMSLSLADSLRNNHSPYSDCYYSFPSFDAWEGGDESEDKKDAVPP